MSTGTQQTFVNPISSLNENYHQNYLSAQGFISIIPDEDRIKIKMWLEKLNSMEGGPEELTVRNDYMWFLLLMLQNQHLTMPFDRNPPAGPLRPLQKILPPHVYREVLMTSYDNTAWIDNIDAGDEQEKKKPQVEEEAATDEPIPPQHFYLTQPVPKQGTICYMGVFSARHHD